MSDLTIPFETQNVHDDDGPVLDSMFEQTSEPPDLKDAVEFGLPAPAVKEPVRQTMIIGGAQLIRSAWTAPTLLLPFDENRKSMTIRVYSPTGVATDGVRISSDLGLISSAGFALHGDMVTDFLVEHTGPVYVQSVSMPTGGLASADVLLSIWAVTK